MPRVINASIFYTDAPAHYFAGYDFDQVRFDEIYERGTTVVCGAGNGMQDGYSHHWYLYPASYDHNLSISSIGYLFTSGDTNIKYIHESTVGDSISRIHQHNPRVDLCAPGYRVSSHISNALNYKYYSFREHSGTSFASPIIAGAAGLIMAGKQRFRCRKCGKSCLKEYINNAFHHESNKWICRLLKEGCGIRSIGRLLEIAVATAMKRIKSIATCIKKPPVALGKKYQLDEIRTFVKCKDNLIWIAYAIKKDTKEVVDFNIGKRTNKTLKTVVNTLLLAQAKAISTDRLKNYKYLIPKKIHRTNVYGINHIERMNLNLRTHLKRLNRRTICFSRSVTMLAACLKIYFCG